MEKLFDSDFYRRLRIFIFGVLLGTLVVYFLIWKDKRKDIYQWPSEIIIGKLQKSSLEYSAHATCRMKCRNISSQDVQDILKTGEINYSKSQVHDKPCPSYALEGNSSDGQHLRIIFASCDSTAKVVTAIDLNLDKEKETCDCK